MSTPIRPPEDSKHARSFYGEGGGSIARDLSLKELTACVRDGRGPLWVDIDTSVRPQLALLEKVFGFHPLSIEDVMNPHGRAKVEAYDGYLFVVLRAVSFDEQTDDPYDLETENIYFFIGHNVLVTAHAGPSRLIDAVAEVTIRNEDLLARGPGRLAHQVMDAAVDSFFPVLDRIDEFIDSLEEHVFQQFREESLRDIFAVKRMVLSLRRYLAPEREIFNVLANRPSPFLTPDHQLYYRDIYDHVLRINDSLDTYRDLLSSTMESYLSQVNNRLGQVTKGLTVVATLSVPFVVVSGMWGMNFDHVPLAHHPYGFLIMLVVQMALGGGLLWMLRRMGLF
ncbi:Cobalt/magnesium transport protein CorA [Gammaproteobacteria bacterium]|nr:Cobalt/magnesium transport protein CorA [Gammaproteobacteria bacterium]